MKTIKLLEPVKINNRIELLVKDHPELKQFQSYIRKTMRTQYKMEQYFKSISKNLNDYIKIAYGPVFGLDDPRNGFIFGHKDTEEMIRIDEIEIPSSKIECEILGCNLISILNTTSNIKPGIITTYEDMDKLQNQMEKPEEYIDLIRDEWINNKTFLLIE
jgi:hypothetical protein